MTGKDYVEQIKAIRIKNRISQTAVGKVMGVHQSMVSYIETGQVDIRIDTLVRYADACGAVLDITVNAREVSFGDIIVRRKS